MHAKNFVRSSIAATLALLLTSACNKSHTPSPSTPLNPPDDDLGISLATLPLLVTTCTMTGNVLNVTVKDGESAYITVRPDDNMVIVNGNMAGSGGAGGGSSGSGGSGSPAPCAVASTGQISIKSDTGGMSMTGRSVIVDYINGVFLKSATAALTGIKIDFTLTGDNGSKNSLRIRGSQNNDAYVFGAGTTAGAALNLNPPGLSGGGAGSGGSGSSSPTDIFPDIVFKNVSQVVVAAGPGDDRLDASGRTGAGVGAVYPNSVSLFGNDGDDVLIGGLGDDTLVGGIGADTLQGCQGDDTYDMGVAAAGADIIAQSCTVNAEGSDTLDYSKRTVGVTLNLSTSLATAMNPAMDMGGLSGESGEMAHISDRLAVIKLGDGDDTINVPSGSTISHRIFGGGGNDVYTGMGVADVYDGEGGDDTCISASSTMDYSARSAPVSVSICNTGCTTANADDGDQSSTGSVRTGKGAATTAMGGIDITTLTAGSGFTAQSVGNSIAISACMTTMGGDNGTYTIVKYVSPTSVKLKIPGSVSMFATDASCSFVETKPDGSTNMGTAAALAAKVTTATVTGLPAQLKALGKTIALTNTATSTGGGMAHTNDNGTYDVLEVLSPNTSVAIDGATPVSGGTMFAGGVTALDFTITGPESDNVQCVHVLGTQGNDTIIGDGRNNVLRGGVGDDTINGGGGIDTLHGEAGADNLYGGAGDDTLYGAIGTDTLVGGDGNDVLVGDADNDMFICDGKNASGDLVDGTVPGDSDFRVDLMSGDSSPMGHGCEF